MTAQPHAMKPPSRLLFALELQELARARRLRRLAAAAHRPRPARRRPPGAGAARPGHQRPLDGAAAQLPEVDGYDDHGWELGRNYGPLPGIERKMLDRVKELADKHGRKVSLVGWSLGGIYARQLAKMLPDEVRCGDHARQPVQRRPARHQRLEALRIHLRPQGRRPRAPYGRRDLRAAAGADHGDLQPQRRHLRLADLRRERRARTPRTSRWRRAIAASAIIRPRSTRSPTGWRSRKASGRSSTAAAVKALFYPDPRRT